MTTLASLVDERCARAYEETYESIDAAAAVPRAHRVCDDDDDELFIVRVSRDVRARDLDDVAFDVAREASEDTGEVATTGETRVGTFSTTTRARAYDVNGDGDGGVLARRGRVLSGVLTVTRALATGEEEEGEERATTTTRGGAAAEDADDDARAKKKEKKRDKEKKKDKKKERARGGDDGTADASRKRSRS